MKFPGLINNLKIPGTQNNRAAECLATYDLVSTPVVPGSSPKVLFWCSRMASAHAVRQAHLK